MKRRSASSEEALTPPRPRGSQPEPGPRSRGGAPGPGPGARRAARAAPATWTRGPATTAAPRAARRPLERGRIGRPTREPEPSEGSLGERNLGATGHAQARLAPPHHGTLAVGVDVVVRAGRLVVAREVAPGVVGAPPEDVPGPPGATRDERPVAVLGAGHLERQLVRWRRAVLADVRAVRVARAADEGAEAT